ncbi:hypothetical protein Sjap_021331 [Stephania japonica]|uniref:Uncharacterized protein n=1 Tax=Stephania japonica TaxID=461633 RepID=A0AAP0HRF0_9MAGN
MLLEASIGTEASREELGLSLQAYEVCYCAKASVDSIHGAENTTLRCGGGAP